MDRGLPTPEFRLRPRHAFFLVDLVLAAVIFVLVGRFYMERKGTAVLQAREKTRTEAQAAAQVLLAQADSVMQAQEALLAQMRADSVQKVGDLERRRQRLEAGYAERQQLAQNIFRLQDAVQGLRGQSEEAVAKAQTYEVDVSGRKEEIKALSSDADEAAAKLDQSQEQRSEAAEQLRVARETRTYEPVGLFPDRSGVAVRQEIHSGDALTNVEFQRILLDKQALDVGVSLGLGLGSGDRTASKQVGLLISRPLVHRRLGLDLSAGYSLLTNQAGENESGAYAAAGLRISPFYKERLHFGLGARADHGEVLPYIGVTVGRR